MKLMEFQQLFIETNNCIQSMQSYGLLATSSICDSCGTEMGLQKEKCSDGKMWACGCNSKRKSISIRKGSFASGSRLSLSNIMLLLHLWSSKYSHELVLHEYSFSSPTVNYWFQFCRQVCLRFFENSRETKIGGPARIVEIDETVIARRKYERGRLVKTQWLFGGIQRTATNWRCFIELVDDRKRETLEAVILRRIEPGTIIISDGWRSYSHLSELGYSHFVVVHEQNFVSPENSIVHTQRIENNWLILKRFIRARGTNKGNNLLEYISEFLFRKSHCDTFISLLYEIRMNNTTF
jgi:ISXO2-like transposase domain